MDAQLSVQHEARVIASVLAGDREHYHELIRPYEYGIYKLALLLMKNEADAEDLTREAFLNTFRKLADFHRHATLSTLLISITLNEARGRLQSSRAE